MLLLFLIPPYPSPRLTIIASLLFNDLDVQKRLDISIFSTNSLRIYLVYPFRGTKGISGGGLAQINNAKGMYIAFATAPNEVASDGGNARNGLFTKHLMHNIQQPNISLDEVFNNTRASVYQENNNKQLPWTSSSVIGKFYFQIDETNINTTSPVRVLSNSSISDTERAELNKYRLEKQQIAQAKEEAELAEFRRMVKLEKEANNKYSLTINPTPSDAKVVITNIKPLYKDGILLKKGLYKIEVSKNGYETYKMDIDVSKDIKKKMTLRKERNSIEKYYIVVGTFTKNPSKRFLSVIKNSGFNYELFTENSNDKKRLLLGPFEDKPSADKALIKAKNRINKSAFIFKKNI